MNPAPDFGKMIRNRHELVRIFRHVPEIRARGEGHKDQYDIAAEAEDGG